MKKKQPKRIVSNRFHNFALSYFSGAVDQINRTKNHFVSLFLFFPQSSCICHQLALSLFLPLGFYFSSVGFRSSFLLVCLIFFLVFSSKNCTDLVFLVFSIHCGLGGTLQFHSIRVTMTFDQGNKLALHCLAFPMSASLIVKYSFYNSFIKL